MFGRYNQNGTSSYVEDSFYHFNLSGNTSSFTVILCKKTKGYYTPFYFSQFIICNDPLQGGHILAHFKVDVIKQPPDNTGC